MTGTPDRTDGLLQRLDAVRANRATDRQAARRVSAMLAGRKQVPRETADFGARG